jgi:hypothetical protein
MTMTFGAIAFMAGSWAVALGLTSGSYYRIVKGGRGLDGSR